MGQQQVSSVGRFMAGAIAPDRGTTHRAAVVFPRKICFQIACARPLVIRLPLGRTGRAASYSPVAVVCGVAAWPIQAIDTNKKPIRAA